MYSHDSVSNAFKKSILKNIAGIWRLCRCASSSLAEINVCMSRLSRTNVVWFWWMKSSSSRAMRILVIIFGTTERTQIGL
jgi:hypothetical protein